MSCSTWCFPRRKESVRPAARAGTMWVHNPRAALMRQVLDEGSALGTLRTVTTTFAFSGKALSPCTCRG